MSQPLKIVAVSGGLQRPSRTQALTEAITHRLAEESGASARVLYLADLWQPLGAALWRNQLSPAALAAVEAIEQADFLVVASPVFRATYTGLFKHLFDFVDQNALVEKPVLLAATGGSERHSLVIDHQLRPLFSFFQARTLPIGVYATDRDFTDHKPTAPALHARIDLAVERALPWLAAAQRVMPALPVVA